MLKKIVSAFVAIAILASLSITVLADPTDTTSPTGAASTETAAPAASPAPTSTNDKSNEFIAQIKAMREQVKALRVMLQTERKLDQQLRSQIRSLKGIVKPDPIKVAEYRTELNPLTAKLKDLTKQLAQENKKKGKNRDAALIEKIKADIIAVQAQIAAVNEKYKDLIAQIEATKRNNLKDLRKQLQPMYASLKPLIAEAKALNRSINLLTVSMKNAVKANDVVKATEYLNQVLAKMELLKQNIAKRIEIRKQMTKTMEEYKAAIN